MMGGIKMKNIAIHLYTLNFQIKAIKILLLQLSEDLNVYFHLHIDRICEEGNYVLEYTVRFRREF